VPAATDTVLPNVKSTQAAVWFFAIVTGVLVAASAPGLPEESL
jgi:hypothetical protein